MKVVFEMSKHSDDWCHVCGHRRPVLADIWYPENAEHALNEEDAFMRTKYIRICRWCLGKAMDASGPT